MTVVEIYTEAAFVLAVAGAAMILPALALIVAALWLVALAIVADRRGTPTESPVTDSEAPK